MGACHEARAAQFTRAEGRRVAAIASLCVLRRSGVFQRLPRLPACVVSRTSTPEPRSPAYFKRNAHVFFFCFRQLRYESQFAYTLFFLFLLLSSHETLPLIRISLHDLPPMAAIVSPCESRFKRFSLRVISFILLFYCFVVVETMMTEILRMVGVPSLSVRVCSWESNLGGKTVHSGGPASHRVSFSPSTRRQ